MRPRTKLVFWSLGAVLPLLLAAPWHAGLSDLARSECAPSPIFDPMTNIVLLSAFDMSHLSRHVRALTTALFVWALVAYWRDRRTAKNAWVLGPLFLLQPIAWIGDAACASRESALPDDGTFVLYPLHLYDVRGLSFVVDAPTTVASWALLCFLALAREKERALQAGVAILSCIAVIVHGSVARHAGMSQLMCSFMLARQLAVPDPDPVLAAPSQQPMELPVDSDQFRVTDDDEDRDEDEDAPAAPHGSRAGDDDDGVPVMDAAQMESLSRAAGGGLPQSLGDPRFPAASTDSSG